MPNKYVYKIMCKEFNLDYSDKLFKYKSTLRNKGDKNKLKVYSDYGIYLDDMFDIIL